MQRSMQTMESFGLNAERKQQELALDFDSRMFGYLKLDDQDSAGQKKLIIKTIACIDKALAGLRREGASKEAVAKRSEVNAKLYCILGHLHLLLSDFAKALSAYQRYYDLDKTSWEDVTFLYGLAIVYFHYNAYKWATRAFQQVLYIEPGFLRASEVHIHLGLIFMVNGDCETSLKHFRLALNDSSPCSISKFEVQFHIAHVYVLQERPQTAKQAYEQLLSVTDLPQTLRANTLQQLGWLYHTEASLGDGQVRAAHAIQLLQKSLEADPTSGQSWYFLGRCFSAIGKVHDAFVSYRHSIDKSEASADTWCSIGVLYQQQSQPMDALQAYICAVQLEKDHTAAWTDLGILYESCSQLDDALTCYKNAAKDTKDVNPTLTNRIRAVEQQVSVQRAPKSSKTLPSIQEAWSLPIPAELTSRQGANSQQQQLQQQQQARVAAVNAAGMAGGYSQMASLYGGAQKPPPPPYPQTGGPPPYPAGGAQSSQHPGGGTPGSSPGAFPGAQSFPPPGGSAEQQTSPARKRRRSNSKKGATEPPTKQPFFLTLQQMQMLRFLQENQTKLDPQQQVVLQHLQQQYFRQQSYVAQQQQQQQQSQVATPGGNSSLSSDATDLHQSSMCDTEHVAFLAEDLLELFMKQQNKELEPSNWQGEKFTSRMCSSGGKSFNGSLRGEKPTEASAAPSGSVPDYKTEHSEFEVDAPFGVRMPPELTTPGHVHLTAAEIIASCKDQNVNSVSNLSILGKCQVPAPPITPSPPLPKDKLNPPTPSVYMETKKEAFSIELQQYVLSQPVCVIRGLATALKLDLGLFSTKSLVESNPEYQVEVRSQRLQTPDDNKDANNVTIWRCESSRSHTTVARYAQYQASSFQESLKEEQDKSKGIHKDSDTDSNSSTKGKKKFRMIKFGTNVDLSNEKKWKAQLQELGKLPAFTRVVAASNMLSHIGHKILGMNTVQLYMKVPGSRTPGHQENLNYAAVNINIGPGDCEWFGVPESYWGVIQQLCEQNGINYLTGSWWPNLEDLFENDVPVYRFIQKPGDLVWVNGGTVHWVQAIGWCNNIAWNVGPLTWKQFVLSAERYEYNKLQLCKSLVPMVQLSWNLARNVHVTDPKLYDLVKTCLCHSLRHSRVVIDYAHSLGKEVKFYGHAENEAAHYCSNCEVEVFNILFVMEQDKKHVVECLECARRSSNILDGFVVLSQYKMDDLMSVYDNFHLGIAPATTGTAPTTAPIAVGTAPSTVGTTPTGTAVPGTVAPLPAVS